MLKDHSDSTAKTATAACHPSDPGVGGGINVAQFDNPDMQASIMSELSNIAQTGGPG